MRLTDELFVDITENFRTLSSIAREYKCSPAAVSKMLSRYIKRNAPVFWGQVYNEYGLNGLRAKIDEFKKEQCSVSVIEESLLEDGFGNYIVELSNRAYRFGFYLTNRETGKTYDKKIVRCDYEPD